MAEITATEGRPKSGVNTYTWSNVTEADTFASILPGGTDSLAGSLHVTGTFGGATVTLQGSNDGVNWATLDDVGGTAISLTSAGAREFGSAMVYFRVNATGGLSQNVTAIVSLKG